MKKLSIRQWASIKRTAQNVNPLVLKKNKMLEQARNLILQAQELTEEIRGYEAGTIQVTGYVSEALVTKVVETTGKYDKDNNPVKVTKYVPTDLVIYNEEENCYYVKEESDINKEEETSTEEENNVEPLTL